MSQTKQIPSRVMHKRDTSAKWTSTNPVILNGEIILVDTDSGELRAKIGDGVKTYTQLPFNDEVLRNLINNTKEYADSQINQHNVSENPHQNMGWITSDDSTPTSPIPIDADTLGGIAADKYVTVGEDGKIPPDKLPDTKLPDNLVYFDAESGNLTDADGAEIGISGGGIVVSSSSPQKTNVLWIDSGNGNIPKFYNPSTSAWEPLASTWG